MSNNLDELERIGTSALVNTRVPVDLSSEPAINRFIFAAQQNWQPMIEELRELRRFKDAGVKAAAFCARLQHADDVPTDITDEAKQIVREWVAIPGRSHPTTDRISYDITKLRAALKVVEEFNRLDLSNMDLNDYGKPIQVSAECLDEWRVIGLSNKEFVELEFWKDGAVRFGHLKPQRNNFLE